MDTNTPTASRRAVLGAAAALSGLLVADGVSAASVVDQDRDIIAAWERHKAAIRALHSETDEQRDSAEYQHLCHELDCADKFIQYATPRTPRGIAVQLWVAFCHIDTQAWAEAALAHGETDAIFARLDDFDFDAQMVLRAIRHLGRLGA